VLLPRHPCTGATLGLIEALAAELKQCQAPGAPPHCIFFLSPVAAQGLAHATSLPEWLDPQRGARACEPALPFVFETLMIEGRLVCAGSVAELGGPLPVPCVVIASDPSLRIGEAAGLLEAWRQPGSGRDAMLVLTHTADDAGVRSYVFNACLCVGEREDALEGGRRDAKAWFEGDHTAPAAPTAWNGREGAIAECTLSPCSRSPHFLLSHFPSAFKALLPLLAQPLVHFLTSPLPPCHLSLLPRPTFPAPPPCIPRRVVTRSTSRACWLPSLPWAGSASSSACSTRAPPRTKRPGLLITSGPGWSSCLRWVLSLLSLPEVLLFFSRTHAPHSSCDGAHK
jgi:hypothetical protein